MLFKVLLPALLAAGASAVPHPQRINADSFESAERREVKARNNPCAQQPATLYAGPVPADDPTSFLNFAPFAAAANSAPLPPGYTSAYTNLHATSNGLPLMGSMQLATYDTLSCAKKCSATTGCMSFNIYFERDPTLEPASTCANPSSMPVIKCILWGAPMTVASAQNTGQWRNNFQVVNTACNGYNVGPSININGYTPLSCYTDQSPNRGLTGPEHRAGDMTLEFCSKYCQGYTYFSVEDGAECRCGNTIDPASKPDTSGGCSTPCAGNTAEICGGFWFMNVYKNPNPGPVPKVNNIFTYQGCYTDGISARGLTGPARSSSSNTLESCATFCAAFPYFSVENGGECYCGNTLESSSTLTQVGCDYLCPGNSAQTCGGFGVMNVYSSPTAVAALPNKVGAFSYQGCYTDNPARALSAVTLYGVPGNTVESCAATCKGYTYFGVEFGVECYCGNVITQSSVMLSDAVGQCNNPCAGNSNEMCGGFWRISIWGNNDLIKSPGNHQ